MPAARAQLSGDLHATKITLSAPPSPRRCLAMLSMSRSSCGKRVSIVSRVSGFQGSRVNESQRLNSFKGTKNLRVSRVRGIPHVNRGFRRPGVSKIQRFQGPRDEGFFQGTEGLPMLTGAFKGLAFPKSIGLRVQGMKGFSGLQGLRVKGIKGSWVLVDPKV